MCVVALRYRVGNRLQANIDLANQCLEEHGLARVDHLVGSNGEIVLIKIKKDFLGLTLAELEELLKQNGLGHGKDPGFEQN